MEQKEFSFDE